MIPVSENILEEVDVIGGTAALIEVLLWDKEKKSQKKYRIAAANYDWDLISNYEYESLEKAQSAFIDLCSKIDN